MNDLSWTGTIKKVLDIVIIGSLIAVFSMWLLSGGSDEGAGGVISGRLIGEGVTTIRDRLSIVEGKDTLVLVLSTTCPFCDRGAEFYRKLADIASHVDALNVVAMFRANEMEIDGSGDGGRDWLGERGITIDRVVYQSYPSLGIPATPMILYLNKEGRVADIWFGELEAMEEEAVINRVRRLPYDNNTQAQRKTRFTRYEAETFDATTMQAVLIDTRERELVGPQAGQGYAHYIPSDELEVRAPVELPRELQIVVDCTVADAVTCFKSTNSLLDLGFSVAILEN